MKRISMIIIYLCVLLLFGCSAQRHFQNNVFNALQPSTLRNSFGTQPLNFKEKSKCPTSEILVNVINVETNNVAFNVVPAAVFSPGWYINPKEFTEQVAIYLKDAYRQCRVINSPEGKIIKLSLKKMEGIATGGFRFNSNMKIQMLVDIPGINISEVFSADQSSGDLYMATAYAVHELCWHIVNDPIIQDYLLCK